LYQAYSSVGRKPAVEPKIMLKIVSYAYSQNIYSSRKIEKACNRDINFRWLLQGCKAPDNASISRFCKEYLSNEVIEDLFYQQVNYLAKQNEILFKNLFIDGTEIEANAQCRQLNKIVRKNLHTNLKSIMLFRVCSITAKVFKILTYKLFYVTISARDIAKYKKKACT
jgi:transposase